MNRQGAQQGIGPDLASEPAPSEAEPSRPDNFAATDEARHDAD
jgi:hypothetical protein